MTEQEVLLRNAGMTKADLARLLRVSRVSAHQWLSGKYAPSPFHAPRLKDALETIQVAVDTGLLPGSLLEGKVSRVQRLPYIRHQLDSARASHDTALSDIS